MGLKLYTSGCISLNNDVTTLYMDIKDTNEEKDVTDFSCVWIFNYLALKLNSHAGDYEDYSIRACDAV